MLFAQLERCVFKALISVSVCITLKTLQSNKYLIIEIIQKGKIKMVKKIVLSAIAFAAVAMVSGGIGSGYAMNQGLEEAKGTTQITSVETVQTENVKMAEAESEGAVQLEKMTFSCDVQGCIQTEVHQHGLCGIDGCTQIGEHSHGICDIAGCTETGVHQHNGKYCYPHSLDDGHAYHNCGVSGCMEKTAHTHGACGIDGCTQTGDHSHGESHESSGNSEGHHRSGNGGGHH